MALVLIDHPLLPKSVETFRLSTKAYDSLDIGHTFLQRPPLRLANVPWM